MPSIAPAPGLPNDRPLRARRRLLWLGAGLACYAVLLVLQHFPWVTERAYATTVSPAIMRALSRVTGVVPFTLFELVILIIIGRSLVALAIATRQVIRRTRRLSNAVACGLLRLGQDAGAL